MRKVLTILFAVALLASCAPSKDVTHHVSDAETAVPTRRSGDLLIMSFNIRNSSGDGAHNWGNRRDKVAAMVLKELPDAMGMQEMLPDQLEYLDSALASDYDRIGIGRDDGKKEGESMCIYYRRSRLQLLNWETRWLSETPTEVSLGWDGACRRTVTIARFRDRRDGKEFLYMNTHLDHVGPVARRESIKLLCDWADQLGKDIPVIIGGDMNSDLSDDIFRPLEQHRLLSARDIAPVTDNEITYNAYGKGKPSVIDHFFVRGWQHVKLFRTLNGDYGVPYISDHYPVVTLLSK